MKLLTRVFLGVAILLGIGGLHHLRSERREPLRADESWDLSHASFTVDVFPGDGSDLRTIHGEIQPTAQGAKWESLRIYRVAGDPRARTVRISTVTGQMTKTQYWCFLAGLSMHHVWSLHGAEFPLATGPIVRLRTQNGSHVSTFCGVLAKDSEDLMGYLRQTDPGRGLTGDPVMAGF